MWRLAATALAVLAALVLLAGCGGDGEALSREDAATIQALEERASVTSTTPIEDMQAAAEAAVEVYEREPDGTVDGVAVRDILRRVADNLPIRYHETAKLLYERTGAEMLRPPPP